MHPAGGESAFKTPNVIIPLNILIDSLVVSKKKQVNLRSYGLCCPPQVALFMALKPQLFSFSCACEVVVQCRGYFKVFNGIILKWLQTPPKSNTLLVLLHFRLFWLVVSEKDGFMTFVSFYEDFLRYFYRQFNELYCLEYLTFLCLFNVQLCSDHTTFSWAIRLLWRTSWWVMAELAQIRLWSPASLCPGAQHQCLKHFVMAALLWEHIFVD